MEKDRISGIIDEHRGELGELMSMLEDVQTKYGYLPEHALRRISTDTRHSLVDIYGVATFYKFFSLKPRGEHLVSVCVGTACHVRGAPNIAREFENQLGIPAGETTTDKKFTLETVNCLGACALGPIVVVNGHYFSKVGKSKVKKILDKTIAGLDEIDIKTDKRIFPIEVSCPRCNHSLIDSKHLVDGYPSIWVTTSFGRKHGWLRLSCLYGSYNIKSEYEIPEDTIVNVFCPHCHAELRAASGCPSCGAPMVPMSIRAGGMVQICSRRGCPEHMLDLNDEEL